MMTICEARRSGLVVLSAESAERSTTHPYQSLDVTWLLCHPDLSGLRINGFVLALPIGPGSTFLGEGGVTTAPGPTVSSRQGRLLLGNRPRWCYLGPAAGQSAEFLGTEKGEPVAPGPTVSNQYGWLLSAIGRTPA